MVTPRRSGNMVQPARRRLVAAGSLYSSAERGERDEGGAEALSPRVIVVCPGDRPHRPGRARRPPRLSIRADRHAEQFVSRTENTGDVDRAVH